MNRKRLFFALTILVCFVVFVGAPAMTGGTAVFAASEAGHGDGGHTPSAPLSFDSLKRDLALWSMVIFLVLFAILAKFAFGPIARALDAREQSVADQISSAAHANDEAKNILVQYQQKLADSRDEVRQILDTARQDAQRAGDGIIEKAKAAAEQEHQRALKDIDAATNGALRSIAERSATLATELAGKMIKKEVTPEAHRELIRGALDEFANN